MFGRTYLQVIYSGRYQYNRITTNCRGVEDERRVERKTNRYVSNIESIGNKNTIEISLIYNLNGRTIRHGGLLKLIIKENVKGK